jgi:eukaryotic-like serine/threonine-protein kinase
MNQHVLSDLLGREALTPELRTPPGPQSIVIKAAYLEYCRRRASGDDLDLEAYCAQFPDVSDALTMLCQCHEVFGEDPEFTEQALGASGWPEVGATWEGFELVEELGRGAFARVYLARELALGERLVAVKITSRKKAESATLGRDEAATLGRLDHPNVVPIYSIREHGNGDLTVVCMPYLGRTTLEQACARLRSGPQPIENASVLLAACQDSRLPAPAPTSLLRRGAYIDGIRWIAARIAAALAYLHERGICHRDLKPSNILLQPDGSPRLLDFNLSLDTLLPTMLQGGTLEYMAPEQLQALARKDTAPLPPQCDVFALGVILCEWLTGNHPFAPLPVGRNLKALLRQLPQLHLERSRPRRALAGVEPALARLLERCLAYDPQERPSAAEVERELQRQLSFPRRLVRGLKRRPWRTAVAAVVLSGALAAAAYGIAQRPTPAQAAFEQGWRDLQAGANRQAWEHFNEALARGANDADHLAARGRASLRLGDDTEQNMHWFSAAFADFERAQQLKPRGNFLAAMGYCAHRLRDKKVAEHYYQQAVAFTESAAVAHHNLGCLYADRAELEKARRHFELALAADDRQAPSHLQLASVLAQQQVLAPIPVAAGAGRPPEQLRSALVHLRRGVPNIDAAPASQALCVAQVFTVAAAYESECVDSALAWLERAVDAGGDPAQIRKHPSLQVLQTQPRFRDLRERPQTESASPTWVRILDPFRD